MTDRRTPVDEPLYRDFAVAIDSEALAQLTRDANGAVVERIPIALSSEYTVERMDFWSGDRFKEVLDHSPGAIDLSRAKDGLPFLDGHDTRKQLGLIENVRLGADKVLRGDVRFSHRQEAQDLKRDMLAGIRKQISVGYKVDRNNVEKTQPDGEKVPTVRMKRWTPFEGSSVAIPADPTVGVGRSASEDARRGAPAILTSHRERLMPNNEEGTSDDTNRNPVVTIDNAEGQKIRAQATNEATEAERRRSDEILAVATAHDLGFDKVREWLGKPKLTVREMLDEAMGIVKERGKKAPAVGTGAPPIELTPKEQREYSLQRAINFMVDEEENPRRTQRDNCFEREVSQELEKYMPASADVKRHGGFLVPTVFSRESVLEAQHRLPYGALGDRRTGVNGLLLRAGLDSVTATKGQELKFTVPGEFLVLLRNLMALMQAGATTLAGLQGPVAFPNQTGAGTATWQTAENPGADTADSNLLLGQVPLNPKSIISTTSYSRQLLAQAVIDVDGIVRSDLASVNALALDLAGINGSGASGQPTGILNTAGIGSVALGTNGLTPAYPNLVDLETQVTAVNADQWPLSHLVHPTTRGTFKKAVALSNTAGLPVWSKGDVGLGTGAIAGGGARVPGELNGYPAWATAQVPNNLTKGTSAGICLAIILGAFSQAIIGDWGMMEIIVDPYRLKKQGMIELTSFAMYGFAVKYAAGFAAIKDALA